MGVGGGAVNGDYIEEQRRRRVKVEERSEVEEQDDGRGALHKLGVASEVSLHLFYWTFS